MSGNTARVTANVLKTLTLRLDFASASEVSSIARSRTAPVLLTKILIWPCCLIAAATTASMSASKALSSRARVWRREMRGERVCWLCVRLLLRCRRE